VVPVFVSWCALATGALYKPWVAKRKPAETMNAIGRRRLKFIFISRK
jgi:hypothetical protein